MRRRVQTKARVGLIAGILGTAIILMVALMFWPTVDPRTSSALIENSESQGRRPNLPRFEKVPSDFNQPVPR